MIRYDRNIEREEGRKAAQFDAYASVLQDYEETAKKRALDREEYGDLIEARDFFKKQDKTLYKKAVRIVKDADVNIKRANERAAAIRHANSISGGNIKSIRVYGRSSIAAKGNSNS